MNHIGNHAPDHEAVGFIYPDRGEVLVPWNEPAEGAALIHLELSFRNLMNHIGNHAPDHEAVGFIYPDRGEVLVPWNEPAEGAALIHLEFVPCMAWRMVP